MLSHILIRNTTDQYDIRIQFVSIDSDEATKVNNKCVTINVNEKKWP